MHSHMHFILAYAILFYLLGSTCYASDTSTDIHEVVDGVYVRLGQTGVGFVDQAIIIIILKFFQILLNYYGALLKFHATFTGRIRIDH